MGHDWLAHNLLLLGLLWLSMLLYARWLWSRPATSPTTRPPTTSMRRGSKEPTPFAGLIHNPLCAACEHAVASHPQAPCAPPPLVTFTRGRRRTVDTRQQFCPADACSYYGWLDRGNIRSNGHPGGKPWRQCSVGRVAGISRRRMARRFMGSEYRPTCSSGLWGHERKGWASARWPGYLRRGGRERGRGAPANGKKDSRKFWHRAGRAFDQF
jgi:hypothetical protein